MSTLRIRTPGGIVADRDLGPSGHTRTHGGFVFYLLSEQPSAAEVNRHRERAKEKVTRLGYRKTTDRCGRTMQNGDICARRAGHSVQGGHKSREAMDRALASYRA